MKISEILHLLRINYIYLFHIFTVSALLLYQTYPLIFDYNDELENINNQYSLYKLNTYILFCVVPIIIIYHSYKLRK
jgi:hypothetical protein